MKILTHYLASVINILFSSVSYILPILECIFRFIDAFIHILERKYRVIYDCSWLSATHFLCWDLTIACCGLKAHSRQTRSPWMARLPEVKLARVLMYCMPHTVCTRLCWAPYIVTVMLLFPRECTWSPYSYHLGLPLWHWETIGKGVYCRSASEGILKDMGNIDLYLANITHTWWRHQMETFHLVAGPLCGDFNGPRRNERLNKQSCGWWFGTPSQPLWCHSNFLAINSSYCHVSFWWLSQWDCPRDLRGLAIYQCHPGKDWSLKTETTSSSR